MILPVGCLILKLTRNGNLKEAPAFAPIDFMGANRQVGLAIRLWAKRMFGHGTPFVLSVRTRDLVCSRAQAPMVANLG